MVLNNKDFSAIDNAAAEFFTKNKIDQKCPRCGSNMVCDVFGNSYQVHCKKDGCISETFHGV